MTAKQAEAYDGQICTVVLKSGYAMRGLCQIVRSDLEAYKKRLEWHCRQFMSVYTTGGYLKASFTEIRRIEV